MNCLAGKVSKPMLLAVLFFSSGQLSADTPEIHIDQFDINQDSSKTFTGLWIEGKAGQAVSRLGIRGSVPGVCRMLGMGDYLRDYLVWSTELAETAKITEQGYLGEISTEFYIQSLTCMANQPYQLKITSKSINSNADGSVTVVMPQIHHGPEHFPIVAGHTGACYLLGYNTAVSSSLAWSTDRVDGVNLTIDGKLYSKDTGTYITALACKNSPVSKESLSETEQPQNKIHKQQKQS